MPPELTRFLDDANTFAGKYGTLLQVLIFPILAAIAGGIKLFRDRQRNRPDLHLELVDVRRAGEAENVTFGLKIINLGEQPATRTRYKWTPCSSLIMTPIPAGFLVAKGEPRQFAFTMESDELIGHALAGAVGRNHYNMLGWLELTYYAGWGRWRKISTAIVTGDTPDLPVQFGKIPKPPWTDYIIPLKKWKENRLRDKDIRDLDQYLQQCRDYLAARDIEVDLLAKEETIRRLFAELRQRGWRSSYETGGRGYEVFAEKHYLPSSHMTIRLSGRTLVDAATQVVAGAILSDERHGSGQDPE